MRCQVFLRGTQKTVPVENDRAPTIGDLRQVVLQLLQMAPIKISNRGNETTLQNQEILLFRNGLETPALLDDDDETLSSGGGVTFTAYEKFTTLPADLYRTVKLGQVHPAVRSAQPTQFTEITPLYCASLTKAEAEYPFFYANQNGRVLVRGASFRCCDTYIEEATIMPWDEFTDEEVAGDYYVNLNHSNFQGTYDDASPFGILHTSRLCAPVSRRPLFGDYKQKSKKPADSVMVTMRTPFWRYKMKKGTDLRDVGMSVVFDKEKDGHFSLIPNGDRSLSSVEAVEPLRQWGATERFSTFDLLVPGPAAQEPLVPEAIVTRLGGATFFSAFPVAAAQKFVFHDLAMKASAQPWDMDVGDDDDDDDNGNKKKLGVACNVVFENCGLLPETDDILCSLDAFRMSEFNMKSVSTSDFDLLRSAMNELLSTDDTIDEAEADILVDGLGVIGNLLKSRAEGTPPLVETPFAGPPLKVARTG